jgi:hypothetical protein
MTEEMPMKQKSETIFLIQTLAEVIINKQTDDDPAYKIFINNFDKFISLHQKCISLVFEN